MNSQVNHISTTGTSEEFAANVLRDAAEQVVVGGAATSSVAPSPVGSAVRLDELDHLRYQLLRSKLAHQQDLVGMYDRECQRAQIDLANLSQEARQLSDSFAEKYGVDMQLNTVTTDGMIMPLPPEQRDSIVRKMHQR